MLKQQSEKVIVHTYNRYDLTLVKGEGCYVEDEKGNKYLDMGSGIAVSSLGHHHPKLTKALKEQLDQLIHTSNLYYTEPAVKAATLLVENSDFEKVFFCNSGAEANEVAIKIARKYGKSKHEDKVEIVSMGGSFHGRTFGALSVTSKEQYKKPFGPLVPHIVSTPFNDEKALEAVISHQTCGVILEVMQGEGGIILASISFLQKVAALCKQYDALLIIDEVQTGIGRTGKLFAYSHYGIKPDMVTTAKGLGAGMPIGAVLVNHQADILVGGDHGTTFGGNLVATKAAEIVLEELFDNGLLEHVSEMGIYLQEQLQKLQKEYVCVVEVRGKGLMWGIEIDRPAAPVIKACMDNRLLVIGSGEKVIRLLPPLIIQKEEIDKALQKLSKSLEVL